MSTVVLVNPSPNITLGERIERLARELESLLPDLRGVVRKFEEIEEKFCKPLLLVNPEELEQYFMRRLPIFTHYVISAMLPVSSSIFLKAEEESGKACLRRLMEIERELFEELKIIFEERARVHDLKSEDLIRAHAIAVDYDLWIISSILKVGFDGFLERLLERAVEEAGEFITHLYSLFYTIMSIDSVIFENAPYRKDTLKTLADWCSKHAQEVEDYLDTLDLLISDEAYETIRDFIEG